MVPDVLITWGRVITMNPAGTHPGDPGGADRAGPVHGSA
jgi:hypothetical protein